ncbi:beta-propeller domain-containing protein [Actinokineospora auranticolor]|uniref:Beta propeller domain-containing protein n=1 Tax=Actinokineospora auranticolor TaxID=155976 RepID=A0A2S6GNM9_9PSEU|nr:beta-propeller domain-containing protein [Actinokineospora auranticolor]PPK66834.1 beta propeller domain-containing protein [Actinokineospora auranticolor]
MAVLLVGSGVAAGAYLAVGGDPTTSDTSSTKTFFGGGTTQDRSRAVRLVAYDDCATAEADLKRAAKDQVKPWGFDTIDGVPLATGAAEDSGAGAPRQQVPQEGGAVAKSAPAPDHSTTNNHEKSADEPDIVKTDGRRVVTITDTSLRVVDVETHRVTSTVQLPGYPTAMLLHGDRALVVVPRSYRQDVPQQVPTQVPPTGKRKPAPPTTPEAVPPSDSYPNPNPGTSFLAVDLAGSGEIAGRLDVDGTYLDGRQVGAVARLVVRSTPRINFGNTGGTADEAIAHNRDIIDKAPLDAWLPHYELYSDKKEDSGRLVECAAVRRPSGYTGTAMLTVLTFTMLTPLDQGDPVAVAADGDTVYGTDRSLYIADDRVARSESTPQDLPTGVDTEIHAFDITAPGKPVYTASGAVDGTLINQYALSEYNGNLRVATTTGDVRPRGGRKPDSESAVSVLSRQGDTLATVGRVAGLGKGERIHSVRYAGTTAYVVTFRQTDPLYTLDLADPANPKVTGALKITGYSAYLHPLAPDRLLGIGQEADERGRVTGLQVSLFDTSGAEARRIGQVRLPGATSDAEFDPHAFLYWAERELLVIPVNNRDGASTVLGLKVTRDAITQVGSLKHPVGHYGPTQVRRSLVAGDALWTISPAGTLVSRLDDLGQLDWVPFD